MTYPPQSVTLFANMAQAAPVAEAKVQAAPKLVKVTLPRPVSLAGTPVQDFSAGKYTLLVDAKGDVEIHDARGNYLVVPKALAILEYRE